MDVWGGTEDVYFNINNVKKEQERWSGGGESSSST